MFNAPAAPAPMATMRMPIAAWVKGMEFGAVSKPTAQVNITKDITLGFISFISSEIIPRSVLDLFSLKIVDCILILYIFTRI